MKKPNISLRQAIIIPFSATVLVIIVVFAILWNYDYKQLAMKQGERATQSMSIIIKDRLKALLQEPYRLSEISAAYISENRLFSNEDLHEIQNHELSVYRALNQSLPQIATISYGDEQGRFAGIRLNEDGSYNLMLKDDRTGGKLVIYEGENTDTRVIAEYDGYDPRTRPWYVQSKNLVQEKWSKIYVNYDEKMESTISTLVRIYDKDGIFQGSMCYDVTLSGLNDYLVGQMGDGDGAIYIVDKDWKLIAHSGNNPKISISSKYLSKLPQIPTEPIQLEIEKKNHFMFISDMEESAGLNWKVVILHSEKYLMGSMKEKQNSLVAFGIIMAAAGGLAGMLIINTVIQPIIKSVNAAQDISNGNYGIQIDNSHIPIRETRNLVITFNKMSEKLKEYFEDLRRNEEKYRTLVENVSHAIFSVDTSGNILSVNHIFERIIGISREFLIGKHFREALKRPENVQYFESMMSRIIEEREIIKFPYELEDSNGKHCVFIVDLIPMINHSGELEMILGTTVDITELDKAQKTIKRLHEMEKRRLRRLVKLKTRELSKAMKEIMEMEKYVSLGSLVSGVAHEINTPLGVAVSAASYMETTNNSTFQMLEAGTMTKSEFIKYIVTMQETAAILNSNLRRAAELVKSFKQMAVDQSSEEIINFNFYDFLQGLLLSLKHEYKNTGIQFDIDCSRELVVRSYPGAFSQIFTNLIMNSLIHGFPNKEGTIKIAVHPGEENLTVTYSDNGKGIDPENMNKIFEPFFTTNRKEGGSGLGLSIVYNIVTVQLKGKITCSSPEHGVLFTIKIPFSSEEDDHGKELE